MTVGGLGFCSSRYSMQHKAILLLFQLHYTEDSNMLVNNTAVVMHMVALNIPHSQDQHLPSTTVRKSIPNISSRMQTVQ